MKNRKKNLVKLSKERKARQKERKEQSFTEILFEFIGAVMKAATEVRREEELKKEKEKNKDET